MEKARHHVPIRLVRAVNTVSTCVFVVTAILVCCTADTLSSVSDDRLCLAIAVAVAALLVAEGLCMWLTGKRLEHEDETKV